jgi:beta-galactosidase/beta-glucuronidase
LYVGNELKDEVAARFGIRELNMKPIKVLVLMKGKFKGVCLHHDLVRLSCSNKESAAQTNEDIKRHGMQCYSQFAQHAFFRATGVGG